MKTTYRRYIMLLMLPLIAVVALLYYVASDNISQYYEHETELANASINSIDTQIQQYLTLLRKNVGHFTENHNDEIKQLLDNPGDKALFSEIREQVAEYFPSAVTFTVADSQGGVLLSDERSLIGAGCRENIRLFAISNEQSDAQIRIHSDPLRYHFDIMHEIRTSDGRVAIFFVTFEPVNIASFIASHQVPGHELMIVRKDKESLIEMTELGSRALLQRDKHVTADEKERILAKKNIDHTLWLIIDILDENKVGRVKSIVFRDTGIIFAAFLFGCLLVFAAVVKHKKA